MNIALVIKYMFPDATREDYTVRDNSDGQPHFIDFWNIKDGQGNLVPEPTQGELEANWTAAESSNANMLTAREISDSNSDFMTVLENLIDVDFDITKLTQDSKDKISERKTLRGQING